MRSIFFCEVGSKVFFYGGCIKKKNPVWEGGQHFVLWKQKLFWNNADMKNNIGTWPSPKVNRFLLRIQRNFYFGIPHEKNLYIFNYFRYFNQICICTLFLQSKFDIILLIVLCKCFALKDDTCLKDCGLIAWTNI